eukprot:15448113-Alexandrium_andersonii.AAC.1
MNSVPYLRIRWAASICLQLFLFCQHSTQESPRPARSVRHPEDHGMPLARVMGDLLKVPILCDPLHAGQPDWHCCSLLLRWLILRQAIVNLLQGARKAVCLQQVLKIRGCANLVLMVLLKTARNTHSSMN